MSKRTFATMTDALKAALADSPESFLSIEKATGVQRASVTRFLKGSQSLRLDLADRLAAHLGVMVNPAPKRKKGAKP